MKMLISLCISFLLLVGCNEKEITEKETIMTEDTVYEDKSFEKEASEQDVGEQSTYSHTLEQSNLPKWNGIEVLFERTNQLTVDFVDRHQGLWKSSNFPVELLIEEGEIYLSYLSDSVGYPVPHYILEHVKSSNSDYPIENLVASPPFAYNNFLQEIIISPSTNNLQMIEDEEYKLGIILKGTNGANETYMLENTKFNYNYEEKDENEENKPKKETAGQRAKREAEARREQEARRRESKRRSEEDARQRKLEEQRKQEEEAIRLEEERRITEEREQQARIDESIKLINNIVNKHLGSFLNGEYELSFISSYKEIIQIVPNSNAYNGNIDSFFQNERLTEEVPTDEWIKLTNIMINLSKELSKEFPDQNLQIQLTDTNHTTGYLILENGEVTLDFAYY